MTPIIPFVGIACYVRGCLTNEAAEDMAILLDRVTEDKGLAEGCALAFVLGFTTIPGVRITRGAEAFIQDGRRVKRLFQTKVLRKKHLRAI
jgi:hypothetical protein